MTQQRSHLDWWQLKLVVPLMLVLIVLDEKYLSLSPLAHQLMLIVTVLVVYGLLAYGLYVHQAGLTDEPERVDAWQDLAKDLGQDVPNEVAAPMVVPPTIQTLSAATQPKNSTALRSRLN